MGRTLLFFALLMVAASCTTPSESTRADGLLSYAAERGWPTEAPDVDLKATKTQLENGERLKDHWEELSRSGAWECFASEQTDKSGCLLAYNDLLNQTEELMGQEAAIKRQFEEYVAVGPKYLDHIKFAHRALGKRAAETARQGNVEKALDHLGRLEEITHVRRLEPTILERLVSQRGIDDCLRAAADILAVAHDNPDQLSRLKSIAERPLPDLPIDQVVRTEFYAGLAYLRSSAALGEREDPASFEEDFLGEGEYEPRLRGVPKDGRRAAIMAHFIELHKPLMDMEAIDADAAAAFGERVRKMRAGSEEINGAPYWAQNLVSSFSMLTESQQRDVMGRAALLAAISYAQDPKRPLPTCPISNQPIRWVKFDSLEYFYSVGPNGIDESSMSLSSDGDDVRLWVEWQ